MGLLSLQLNFRDIEDLLAEKGISVSYESIRLWCIKFGPTYARRLKQKHGGFRRLPIFSYAIWTYYRSNI